MALSKSRCDIPHGGQHKEKLGTLEQTDERLSLSDLSDEMRMEAITSLIPPSCNVPRHELLPYHSTFILTIHTGFSTFRATGCWPNAIGPDGRHMIRGQKFAVLEDEHETAYERSLENYVDDSWNFNYILNPREGCCGNRGRDTLSV
ncbi:hypothetical protein DOTSEDRAFT_21909 [Dothistroma septosporum NZE10]|uniref:Uncharacterized protein n=1 Tax=Dothistroma septosporum (strain NZE10 / CBS 128990) TaxID=675120 RepID=N1PXE8_DOTSN|nr:hypothetical protein DOTSEDRAFT_21909 [Dothistroma septosporum NZE10]